MHNLCELCEISVVSVLISFLGIGRGCQQLTIPGRAAYDRKMNVNLGPKFDQFVTELVKSGLYLSQSEVLREGLRLLKEREDLKETQLAALRKEIALGVEEADRGEFRDGPRVFARIRRKSAARKRGRR